MPQQVPLLVVVRMRKFLRAAGKPYHHHALPYPPVGVGESGVEMAGIQVLSGTAVVSASASYPSQIFEDGVRPISGDRIIYPAMPAICRKIYILRNHGL